MPRCLDAIPPKARNTLMDRGFSYHSTPAGHLLWYVETPPFGRPTYDFERGRWGYVD